MNGFKSNDRLVEYLADSGYIESDRVQEAFRAVDRKKFVPKSERTQAYDDRPLRIAKNSTISAPHMVAINTEQLMVKEGFEVLEIGSGSGYQLAIVAELTSGRIVGTEIMSELVEKSRRRLKEYGNVEVFETKDFSGLGEFDRVLYSCAVSEDKIDYSLVKEGGVILVPVIKGDKQVLTRFQEGRKEELGSVRFVEMS